MVPHNRLLLEGLLEYPDNLGSSLELLSRKSSYPVHENLRMFQALIIFLKIYLFERVGEGQRERASSRLYTEHRAQYRAPSHHPEITASAETMEP